MINLISQGKIIRQFWDKIIRHSTGKKLRKMRENKVNQMLPRGGGAILPKSHQFSDSLGGI